MKKFVTLFTDSARELKSVRTITTMAMLAAVAVILGYFSIEYGQFKEGSYVLKHESILRNNENE